MVNKLIKNEMSKSQKDKVNIPATKGILYLGIGQNVKSRTWFINSGYTTSEKGIVGRYGKHIIQAFYWQTIELASFDGFTRINKKIATALRNAQKRVKKGKPINVAFGEEYTRVNLKEGNLMTTFEWLTRECLRDYYELQQIVDTSQECYGYIPTFDRAKEISDEVIMSLTEALNLYLSDIAEGATINRANAKEALIKARTEILGLPFGK